MKTLLTLLALIAATSTQASCFSLYQQGQRIYQSKDAPFDVSAGSADLAKAEAQGVRLVISPDETCDRFEREQMARAIVAYRKDHPQPAPVYAPQTAPVIVGAPSPDTPSQWALDTAARNASRGRHPAGDRQHWQNLMQSAYPNAYPEPDPTLEFLKRQARRDYRMRLIEESQRMEILNELRWQNR